MTAHRGAGSASGEIRAHPAPTLDELRQGKEAEYVDA
jgi:hypothetical protein